MSRPRWSILLIIVLLLLPALPFIMEEAQAGEPIFMANSLVNWEEDRRTFKQRPTDILVTDQGRIYVAYQSGMSWMPMNVYVAYSDDNGATWSRSFRIDDTLKDGNFSNDETAQANPRLAQAPNGTIYAVWQDNRDFTHTQQIRMAWTNDGENFSRSVRIDEPKPYPNMEAGNPSIEIAENGRIIVAWEDKNQSGSYWNVYCSYSDDGGRTWSRMVRINSDNMHSRQHEYTRLAVYGEHVYITWHDNRDDGQYRPYFAVSHDGGETFLDDKALSDDLELYNSRQWASPAVDDAGNVYVAWRDKRSGFHEIWYTRSEDNGMTFSDNKRLAVVPEGAEDSYPSVAARGNGEVSVAFQRKVTTDDSVDEGEIMYINSSDGGRTWDSLMRVDDTDRTGEDRTIQERPVIEMDGQGRALVAWSDERNGNRNNYYSDVWFSRHSGDLSGPNNPPVIYDMGFLGNFTFNREVGSPVSPFIFSCNISDEDNDRPLPGYPRIHVYNDSAGNDPLLDVPPVMVKMEPRDIDNINGVYYETTTSLPSKGGQLYYRIEVLSERDRDSTFSPIMKGPVIDANPPKFTVLSPVNMEWITDDIVRCSVKVEDLEGGFVNPNSIRIKRSVVGPDQLDKGVPLTSLKKIDNNTFTGSIDLKLENGKLNYIQFEARDMVRNYGTSELVNVWVDAFAPFYTGIGPGETQLYETVNCTIDWMDRLPGSTIPNTGLDISSIEYSYKTTSGDFSDWMKPEGIKMIGNGSYRAWVNLIFENNGVYNYIRWRAKDNGGNLRETHDDPDHPNGGITLKIDVKVPDNYPPQFMGKAYPSVISSPTPHFFWDDAFDEEGDTIYYKVMIMKNNLEWTNWIGLGQRTFYDVANSVNLQPDWYILRINATDRIGGYDLYDHQFRIIDGGTPPPDDIPTVDTMYTSPGDYIIEWEDTPSFAFMNITYWFRMGTEEWLGDIKEWTPNGPDREIQISDLDLDVGIYSVQYMAENNGNFSRVSQSTLKINDYNIEAVGPDDTFKSYRGKGDGINVELYNWATYRDNVTVKISGEIVDKGWAYLDDERYSIDSHVGLTIPEPEVVSITIFPQRNAEKGIYTITLTATSEDGETETIISNITVKITDKPQEGFGGEITDTLYDVITDIFPFLEPLSPTLVSGVFLFIVLVLIAIIATIGIIIYRKQKANKDEDPYVEQRKLYKELYGTEPTLEQLKDMKESSVVDEVLGDLDEEDKKMKKPRSKGFDESYLRSERKLDDEE